jgi:hypothetical protein
VYKVWITLLPFIVFPKKPVTFCNLGLFGRCGVMFAALVAITAISLFIMVALNDFLKLKFFL